MVTSKIITLAVALGSMSLGAQPKTELRPATTLAYDNYVAEVEHELDRRLTGDIGRFLAVSPNGSQKAQLREGAINPEFTERGLKAPDGLIQDWTATMFVDGATGDGVIAVLTDYDRHKDVYPEVIESKLLRRDGTRIRSYLRLLKEKVFTVVLDTEHAVEILKTADGRWQLRSRSTRINEIRDAGKPNEEMLPEGQDSGFLWRLNGYWSIQEADGGVYVECRSVTLTRDAPMGLGWIVKPFTLSLPRDSLVTTLQATKQAVQKRAN